LAREKKTPGVLGNFPRTAIQNGWDFAQSPVFLLSNQFGVPFYFYKKGYCYEQFLVQKGTLATFIFVLVSASFLFSQTDNFFFKGHQKKRGCIPESYWGTTYEIYT